MRLATIHRKMKKQEYRGLWIVRLSAACRQHGMPYNRLIDGLTKLHVRLNRKMLSEIAIRDPEGFAGIVKMVQSALA
jgi:large subunit ribosomal protein L20